jgi:hypothetical protein
MKSQQGSVLHQFHSRRDHLRSSVSPLPKVDVQLQGDLNSARAKLGAAANLHYVRSCHEGTPTLLSRAQISHLCMKHSSSQNSADKGVTTEGETDNIYKFLEELGNYYITLLARGPTMETERVLEPYGTSTLFNETQIGQFINQEDLPITGDGDTEMLRIVDNHRRGLQIDDSKEVMVGIAYAMPFELEQFGLFHVSMHIDATADSNKGRRQASCYCNIKGFVRAYVHCAPGLSSVRVKLGIQVAVSNSISHPYWF